jgi:hypothetical protein
LQTYVSHTVSFILREPYNAFDSDLDSSWVNVPAAGYFIAYNFSGFSPVVVQCVDIFQDDEAFVRKAGLW